MRRIRFFNRLPSPQVLKNNRFLKPFARYLDHHSLWQFNRRGVASGVAIGLFFGLLMPFAQIFLAAIGAIVWRANLPVAAFSTFITNPFTFAPIYYLAYKLGSFLTGGLISTPDGLAGTLPLFGGFPALASGDWFGQILTWAADVGLPLSTGLSVLAVGSAALGYAVTSNLWRWHVTRRWQKRQLAACPKT